MILLIMLLCTVAALAIYFVIIRPFCIPLEWRIPTGRAYRATLGAKYK